LLGLFNYEGGNMQELALRLADIAMYIIAVLQCGLFVLFLVAGLKELSMNWFGGMLITCSLVLIKRGV